MIRALPVDDPPLLRDGIAAQGNANKEIGAQLSLTEVTWLAWVESTPSAAPSDATVRVLTATIMLAVSCPNRMAKVVADAAQTEIMEIAIARITLAFMSSSPVWFGVEPLSWQA